MALFAWVGFLVLVLALLALDLGIFHRKDRELSIKKALLWTSFYITLAFSFGGVVYWLYSQQHPIVGLAGAERLSGTQAMLQYWTGFLVEESLSMDNLFVIALIFTYFGIPPALQHRVLYWGILGALILRGLMIVAGAALIARFEWVIYIFGGLLLITALRLLRAGSEKVDPDRNLLVRAARRLYPVTSEFHGHHFFVKVEGIRTATPLFVALVAVESTDLLFAFDSIPAIFAITRDPFLVFTSNVFAVLGLRSLYFALAGMVERFHYLKPALVTVLAFIGVKMLLSHHLRIPTGISLTFIASILAVGVGASLLSPAERDGSDGDGESGSTTPS